MILIILIVKIRVSYDQNIFLKIFYIKDGTHGSLRHPSSVYITVHCSTKDAYNSELTILAL